jgi:hypothetical protein
MLAEESIGQRTPVPVVFIFGAMTYGYFCLCVCVCVCVCTVTLPAAGTLFDTHGSTNLLLFPSALFYLKFISGAQTVWSQNGRMID